MPFLKSLTISDDIFSKFGIRGTPEYQRVTSKGSRTMGSEWPDKFDKTRFGSVARGGGWGDFFEWSSSPTQRCWLWGGLSNGTVLPMNSSPPSAAYMCQWIGSALVQIIACCLYGIKPLSKPNAGLLLIGPIGANFSEISIKIQKFSFTKMHLKISLAKWHTFCPVGNELTNT